MKMKVGVILGLFYTFLLAQVPDTLWTKTYGGTGTDQGRSVQQTTDNGYIITGVTSSFGSGFEDFWLLKTDDNGDTLWTKTYGGIDTDQGYSVQQTNDNGYIMVGYTRSFGAGNSDFWLLKTDANGDTLWAKTYGGAVNEQAYFGRQTIDNGYIITGSTSSFGAGGNDIYLVKTDENGDTLWTKCYGGIGSESGQCIQQTTDGYIVSGSTSSFGTGGSDFWLLRIDENGDTLWTKTYGGTGSDIGYSVQQTIDNGYIITGSTNSFGAGNDDIYLIKTDENGDTLWTKTYGGASSDVGFSVQQTNDNGYIIAGYTQSFGIGNRNVWLIKTSENGDTLWTRTYGSSGYNQSYSVQQTNDNGYITVGWNGVSDLWLLKVGFDEGIISPEIGSGIPAVHVLSQNYPNPFKTETEINYQLPQSNTVIIAIYNVSGQHIKTLVNGFLDTGYYTVQWNGQNQDNQRVSNGVYFCRMQVGKYISMKKMLLTR